MSICARPRALVWLLVLPLALSAAESPPPKFSIAVRHVTLAELAPILSRLGGAEVVVDLAVSSREVSVIATDQPLEAVLAEVAKTNNLTWRRDGARYVLAGGSAQVAPAGVVTRCIPLKYRLASEVASYFGQPSVVPTATGGQVLREAAPLVGGTTLNVPDGIVSLMGYDLLSALMVVGRPDAIEELMQTVALIDVPRRQITTETTFVLVPKATAQALGVDLAGRARGWTGHYSALLQALRRSQDARLVTAPKIHSISGEPSQLRFRSTVKVAAGEYQQQFEIRIIATAPADHGHTVLDVATQWWVGPDLATRVFEAHAGPVSMRIPSTESLLVAMEPEAVKGQAEAAHADLRRAIFGPQAASLSDLVMLAVVAPGLIREEGVDYAVGAAK